MAVVDLSDSASFEAVYRQYHAALCRYAKKYVRDGTVAEEIVQELFLHLWERAERTRITTSLASYLYLAVRNRCLNYLKHQFSQGAEVDPEADLTDVSGNAADEAVHVAELEKLVREGIGQLPEKCRIIFQLSRDAGLSYREIAHELNISIKTVEAQMGTALKRLRNYVNQHGYGLVWLLGLLGAE